MARQLCCGKTLFQVVVRVSWGASVSQCECLGVRVTRSASVSECKCLVVRVSQSALDFLR